MKRKGRYKDWMFAGCVAMMMGLCLLVSCQHSPLRSRVGTPMLGRQTANWTATHLRENPPSSVKDVAELMKTKPEGRNSNARGTYTCWACYELQENGQFYEAVAGTLTRKGKLVSWCVKTPRTFGGERIVGDGSLFDFAQHPGMKKAYLPFFRRRWKSYAASVSSKAYFSPDGTYCFVPPAGQKVVGWKGNQAIVKNTNKPLPTSASEQQIETQAQEAGANWGLALLEAFANAYIANKASSAVAPAPVSTQADSNPQWLQDFQAKQAEKYRKAAEDHDRIWSQHVIDGAGFSTF